ncbi:MAG: 50S ribosomal protein L20 [Anaerolineae bacterium]
MPRVKGGPHAHSRHRKVLTATKGQYSGRHRLYKTANEALLHSLEYATRDRKRKKRDFRRLWIQRINAGARLSGLSYSQFMHGLSISGITLDRKVLADLAVADPTTFAGLVETAKGAVQTAKA